MAIDTSAPVAPTRPGGPGRQPLRRRATAGLLLPLVLLLVAGSLRFYRLDHPPRIYFDETYYATQARQLLDRGVEEDFAVHPPLGKWLIAAGVAVAGYDPFGWRVSAATAGTLLVLMTYLLGLRLFRRRGVAALAAFLLAIDGLAFTMSRIAMLDVFLALFVTAGAWLLLRDRDLLWTGTHGVEPDARRPLPRRPHHWRWLAGLTFGLALATKWSAALAIAGGIVFVLASELLWRRRLTGSMRPLWWRAAASAGLTLVVLPAVVYLASYAAWFANFPDTRPGGERCPTPPCDVTAPQVVGAWWGEQGEIWRFHRELEAEHPYRSSPWGWLLLLRPVAYYYEACDDDKLAAGECVTARDSVEEILGMPNPAIWWAALAAYPYLAWLTVRRRDWRAAVPLGGVVAQYLPFLAALVVPLDALNRPNFIFYLTPALPFVCLAVAAALWRAGRHPFLRWMPAALAVLAVVAFLYWYPLYTGVELPRELWRQRMWLDGWI